MDFNLTSEALIGSLLALVALFLFCRSLLVDDVLYIPGRTRHGWKTIKMINRACFCSICEILLPPSTGLFCDCCGVCAHQSCTKQAEIIFKCKEKWVKNGKSITHLWVKGNLPLNSYCYHCNEDIDAISATGLFEYRCCWCQKMFHNNC